jgi:hypothetical protein
VKNSSLIAIAVLTASCAAAVQPGGLVYPHGSATLNGRPLEGVTSFAIGDRFATNNGTVTIGNNTSRVVLQSNSSAIVRGHSVDFGCGSGLVRTQEALVSHIGSVEVKPQSAVSSYTVHSLRDKQLVEVTAEVGHLSVSHAGRVFTLAAGESKQFVSACEIVGEGNVPAAVSVRAPGMSTAAKAAVVGSVVDTATVPLYSMAKNASPHK